MLMHKGAANMIGKYGTSFYSERPWGAGFRSVNQAERWRENPARALARAGFSQHQSAMLTSYRVWDYVQKCLNGLKKYNILPLEWHSGEFSRFSTTPLIMRPAKTEKGRMVNVFPNEND